MAAIRTFLKSAQSRVCQGVTAWSYYLGQFHQRAENMRWVEVERIGNFCERLIISFGKVGVDGDWFGMTGIL